MFAKTRTQLETMKRFILKKLKSTLLPFLLRPVTYLEIMKIKEKMAFQNNHLFGKPKSSLRTVGTIFSLENRKKMSITYLAKHTSHCSMFHA